MGREIRYILMAIVFIIVLAGATYLIISMS